MQQLRHVSLSMNLIRGLWPKPLLEPRSHATVWFLEGVLFPSHSENFHYWTSNRTSPYFRNIQLAWIFVTLFSDLLCCAGVDKFIFAKMYFVHRKKLIIHTITAVNLTLCQIPHLSEFLPLNNKCINLSFQLKVNCLIKRGSMHLQATKLQECVQDFKKAISLDPENSDIYHHRGQVCLLLTVSWFSL